MRRGEDRHVDGQGLPTYLITRLFFGYSDVFRRPPCFC